MSTSVTYDFSDFISKFDNSTSISNDWKVIFNGDYSGIATGDTILSSPSSFGNLIKYNNGLKLYGSSIPLTILGNPIYTNPGETSLRYVGSTENMSSVIFKISEIKNPTTQLYRSYDLFENISNKALEDNYSYEKTFVGLGNGSCKVGLVIIKPPSKLKVRNKNLYVQHIKELGAIGDTSYVDYSEVCDSSLFSENERILSIVYEKNGKYYDVSTLTEYTDYNTTKGKYSMMYSGSGSYTPLLLTNIGTDGRKINGGVVNTSLIDSDYVVNKLDSDVVMNNSFYPYKEENTSINVTPINKNNPFEVCVFTSVITDSTLITIKTKDSYGNLISSSSFSIPETNLVPEISVTDFSEEYSISLDSIVLTYSVDTSDTNLNTYSKKHVEPYFALMTGTSISDVKVISTKDIILAEGYYPYVLMANTNDRSSTTNVINVYKKTNGEFVFTENHNRLNYYGYDCIQLFDGVGEYLINGHVESQTDDGIYPSKIIENIFHVYNKITPPIIDKSYNDYGSGRINMSIEVTHPELVDCYFSIDGNEPNMIDNTYLSRYFNANYPIFSFNDSLVIKAFAFDGIQKSDTVTLDAVLTKTVQVTKPIIFGTFNSSTNKYDISFTGIGSILYTLDGTTPTNKSTRYYGPFSVSPLIGNKLTIKAISIQIGSIDSEVASLTIDFNYSCSPWNVEYGKVDILDNKVKIHNNTLMSRRSINSNNYVMKFNISDWDGSSDLIVTTRESILDTNNYSNTYFKNKSFILSSTYNDDNIAVISIGIVNNNFNRDRYKVIGETIWNKTNSLYFEYTVNNSRQKIKLSNFDRYVSSEEYPIDVANKTTPAILFQNIGGQVSSIDIGNIEIKCL